MKFFSVKASLYGINNTLEDNYCMLEESDFNLISSHIVVVKETQINKFIEWYENETKR